MIWKITLVVSCIKLLLSNTYRSTDFEVHRNWLAVTYSLPVWNWYTDTTSEWTIDYPPLFAWFEFFLSQIAAFVDPKMLIITNLNYASNATVLFQRLSVIFSDLVLAYGTKKLSTFLCESQKLRKCSKRKHQWRSRSFIYQVLVLFNFGLLIVDHIHFQYNGIMLGLLLISISEILNEKYIMGTFWYSILINVKHIYLYMAPAFGIYILRNYCCSKFHGRFYSGSCLFRIMCLSSIIISVFSTSFGPFYMVGQLKVVLARLFPFKRGLCHAYWAPNVWALYNMVDKLIVFFGKLVGYRFQEAGVGTMTSGLVADYQHTALPTITPFTTMILTLLFITPCLWKLWTSPGNPLHFLRSIIICTSVAFLLGWHVHEKAILMIIIPQSLLAVLWRNEAKMYCLLSIVGHYSLLPLLFTPEELFIKTIMYFLFCYYVFSSFVDLYQANPRLIAIPLLSKAERIYIYGFIPLFVYHNVLHGYFNWNSQYPFAPLMLTSCYCAVGVIYSVIRYYISFMCMSDRYFKQKTY